MTIYNYPSEPSRGRASTTAIVAVLRVGAALLLVAGAKCSADGSDRAAARGASSSTQSYIPAAHQPPLPPVSGGCPVPVCRYAGTAWAEDLIGDELLDRGSAEVLWTFSHMNGREAVYRPSGKVGATWTSDRCTITLEPAEVPIDPTNTDPRHAFLRVDFTTLPVRYSAEGTSGWAGSQHWTCAGNDSWTQEEGGSTRWLAAREMTSPERGRLHGTFGFETGRSGWDFEAIP